jgi:UDP-N-acetylglucosamine acyltransferase
MNIHASAIIEPGAIIGTDCEIQAYAVIHRHARLGNGVKVFPHAVVGGDPQDLGFDGNTPSFVTIQDHCVLREHVTVHRSTQANGSTVVGAHSYLMANSHVAHDCQVGEHVILANAVLLAGHVQVADKTFIGGGAAIHQFVRIGAGAMIGGLARITRDCPPFGLVAERDELSGLNIVGLRRRKVTKSVLSELKQCYQFIYASGTDPVEQAAKLRQQRAAISAEAMTFVEFFYSSKRGFVRPNAQSQHQ